MIPTRAFHAWFLSLSLLALAVTGCPSSTKTDPSDLPKPAAQTQVRGSKLGGTYAGPEAISGEPQELADMALAPNIEVSERRMAARGLVSHAMGIEPAEIQAIEANRFRMAKVATVVRGTADMESVEHLRTLMRESQDTEVVADSVRGLGHVRDIDSVPEMLELLSHQDTAVNEAAQYSVSRILGLLPAGGQPPAQFYREMYKKMSDGNPNLHELIKLRGRQQAAQSAAP